MYTPLCTYKVTAGSVGKGRTIVLEIELKFYYMLAVGKVSSYFKSFHWRPFIALFSLP